MENLRLKLLLFLYDSSSKMYASLFKPFQSAWGISKMEFLKYEQGSLGHSLGQFYHSKGFDVMPKLENHDVFHLLTETDTQAHDEIAMQFLLFGNGKISVYLIGVLLIGSILFPEYWTYYLKSFQKGKSMYRFYDVDFRALLTIPLQDLQYCYQSKNIVFNLK